MSSIGYRPEIDGLRALAVIPVILFHLKFGWISGGYIGVDVFFVISGYLITSIVSHELDAGTFTFRGFWARRIRRILPALLVVIATSLVITKFCVFKGEHPEIGEQAGAAVLSFANLYFRKNIGEYWGANAEQSPLLQTWSLSVEEQFYLIFPLAIWLVMKYFPHWLRCVLIAVIISSLCLFLDGVQHRPTATFYFLRTRAWELATGCYLAIACHNASGEPQRDTLSSLALAGLGMIFASYFFVPVLNGGLAVAVIGTALVIAFSQSGFCQQVLSQWPLVAVGKMSYSLYLWHWPVIVFAEKLGFAESLANKGLMGVLMLTLSIASYRLIEQPTRRRPGIIPLIAVAYALTLGFAASLAFSHGTYDTSEFEQPTSYQLFYDLRPQQVVEKPIQRVFATIKTPPREAPADAYRKQGIIVGEGDGDPQVVVLGDSHGTMWCDAIRTVTQKMGLKTCFFTMNAVTPFVKFPLSQEQEVRYLTAREKYEFDQARIDCIQRWKPHVVIICTIWSGNAAGETTDLLKFLEESAAHVLLMEQPPELPTGNRNVLQLLCFQGVHPQAGQKHYFPMGNAAAYQRGRTLVRTLAKSYRNTDFIPMADLFSRDSETLVLDGKNVVYSDDDHLTTYGGQLGVGRIEEKISTIMKEKRE